MAVTVEAARSTSAPVMPGTDSTAALTLVAQPPQVIPLTVIVAVELVVLMDGSFRERSPGSWRMLRTIPLGGICM